MAETTEVSQIADQISITVAEKKVPSVDISISSDVSPTSGGSLARGIKWLADKAVKLQMAITKPSTPPRFQEPSGDETAWDKFKIFLKFMGPGAIISVAYIDPDNFQTNIAAGASFQYKQLFMLFLAMVVAIYLQVCAYFLALPLLYHSRLLCVLSLPIFVPTCLRLSLWKQSLSSPTLYVHS